MSQPIRMLVALLVLVGTTSLAHAEGAAQCTIVDIKASNEKKGLDPKLERFKALLRNPPASAYDTFQHRGEHSVTAEQDKPVSAGNLTVTFKGKTTVSGGKARLRFTVETSKPKSSNGVNFDSGGGVVVGGTPLDGGAYIGLLSCTAPWGVRFLP